MRQQFPRGITIAVAAVLLVIGVLGTFLGLIPNIGSIDGELIGIGAYIASSIVMLAGVFIRGL